MKSIPAAVFLFYCLPLSLFLIFANEGSEGREGSAWLPTIPPPHLPLHPSAQSCHVQL